MKNSCEKPDVYVKLIRKFLWPDFQVIKLCSVFFWDLIVIFWLSQLVRNMDVLKCSVSGIEYTVSVVLQEKNIRVTAIGNVKKNIVNFEHI